MKHWPNCVKIARQNRGISLIEVLVALVILSLGVLAVVALQLVSKRNNADASQRMVAAQLAFDLTERIRANSAPEQLKSYQTRDYPLGVGSRAGTPPKLCTAATPCTAAELVLFDHYDWEKTLDGAAETVSGGAKAGGLVSPQACVSGPALGGNGLYTITIAWRSSIVLPDNADVTCGSAAVDADGNRLYGDVDKFRRTLTLQAYITARPI